MIFLIFLLFIWVVYEQRFLWGFSVLSLWSLFTNLFFVFFVVVSIMTLHLKNIIKITLLNRYYRVAKHIFPLFSAFSIGEGLFHLTNFAQLLFFKFSLDFYFFILTLFLFTLFVQTLHKVHYVSIYYNVNNLLHYNHSCQCFLVLQLNLLK